MRLGLLALPAIVAGLFSLPVSAQSLPTCSGIALVSPTQGAHFLGSRPIMFRWSGEPVRTASRELHLAALDGSETVIPLEGRFSDTVKVNMKGDLGWIVVFLDANGQPLCTSPAGLLVAGAGGGTSGAGTASISSPGGAAATAPVVSIFMHNGRLVIVLQNSPYAGPYTRLVNADGYDGSTEPLLGATGLEIHGNEQPNFLIGSTGSDLIYSYGGNDLVRPLAGQDEVHFGTATALVGEDTAQTQDNEVDKIYFQGPVGLSGSTTPEFPGQVSNFDRGLETFTFGP